MSNSRQALADTLSQQLMYATMEVDRFERYLANTPDSVFIPPMLEQARKHLEDVKQQYQEVWTIKPVDVLRIKYRLNSDKPKNVPAPSFEDLVDRIQNHQRPPRVLP